MNEFWRFIHLKFSHHRRMSGYWFAFLYFEECSDQTLALPVLVSKIMVWWCLGLKFIRYNMTISSLNAFHLRRTCWEITIQLVPLSHLGSLEVNPIYDNELTDRLLSSENLLRDNHSNISSSNSPRISDNLWPGPWPNWDAPIGTLNIIWNIGT